MAIRLRPDEVETAAMLHGVPPELALAIWQQESSRGANARTSPKGAVGGFQVMPATFRRYMPNGDINDPVDNMMAGLKVLRDGLNKSGGDPEGAAQFYYHGKLLAPGEEGPNSGPGTPTTREYAKQVVAKMGGARGAPEPASMYGGSEETTPDLGLYASASAAPAPASEEAPDIAGLTRPLDQAPQAMAMSGDWLPPHQQNYELDQYIRRIVDEEFKNA